jgi:prevent-host-death family protein
MKAVVNIHYAKTHLSRLLERVLLGEEITIAKAGKPVAKLVPLRPSSRQRIPGSARGKISMTDDFDAPLPDEVLRAFHE